MTRPEREDLWRNFRHTGTYRALVRHLKRESFNKCCYCEQRPRRATVDHAVPQSDDHRRLFDHDNLLVSCRDCNEEKGAHVVLNPYACDPDELFVYHRFGGMTAVPGTAHEDLARATIEHCRLDRGEPPRARWLCREMLVHVAALTARTGARNRDELMTLLKLVRPSAPAVGLVRYLLRTDEGFRRDMDAAAQAAPQVAHVLDAFPYTGN